MSPMGSSSKGQVVTSSCSPAGDVLPLLKPDSETAVLSDPAPCCSLLSERSTEEVLREDRLPSFAGSLALGKKMLLPPRSNSPLASASRKPCKRKMFLPPLLWLPPLLGDQGELALPPKWPCLFVDRNLGTLENTECQGKKTLKDKTEVMADGNAP